MPYVGKGYKLPRDRVSCLIPFLFLRGIMGFISTIKNIFRSKAMDSSVPGSYPAGWLESDDSITGATVNSWTALRQSAVLQCVRLYSNGISQVPFRLMGKEHKPAEDDPLYYLFKEGPNRWQSAYDFWRLVGFHLALQGNIIIWIIRVRGVIRELIPFPPQNYIRTLRYDSLGFASYEYTLIKDDGSTVIVPERDAAGNYNIWVLNWVEWDVQIGISQLDLVKQVVSIAIAGDKLSGTSFKNGCRLEGLLMAKHVLQPDQKKQIREEWQAIYGGSGNSGKTAILGADMEYKPISQNNSDAQFVEQKKFQIEEICRAWNINPLLVFYFDNTTSYSNAEQMMVQHAVYTMAPWYRMIEDSADKHLLTERQKREQGLYFAFSDTALMRTDAKSRAEFYAKLFNIGSITPNEIRSLEDMPPKEGGDELYIQGAVVPLKDAGIWQDKYLQDKPPENSEDDNQEADKETANNLPYYEDTNNE